MAQLSYETILQILDLMDPVAVFDSEGHYLYVNQSWRISCDITLSIEELQKLHPWDLFSGSRVEAVIKTQRPIIGEIITINSRPACVSYFPIFTDDRFDGVLMWQVLQGLESASKAAKMVDILQQELASMHSSLDQIKREEQVMADIVGNSPAIKQLRSEILAAARTNSTVLIEGETGTGKELTARAIHRLSKRSGGRFVPVNCSAIPESLMESEFFGYDPGAFTGARRSGHMGKMELANGGTLFLDEIHQMSLSMQPKLLRALQERQIERLAGSQSIPVDFRCLAATNVNLKEFSGKGLFRDDLYYRLNVVYVKLPPLRNRKDDIPVLVKMFIDQLNARLETNIITINESALQKLMDYDWPGNVRELQNAVESAMNRAGDGILEARHFRLDIPQAQNANRGTGVFQRDKALFEKDVISKVMRECNWNKSAAAAKLGISRSVLYSKLRKYGLE